MFVKTRIFAKDFFVLNKQFQKTMKTMETKTNQHQIVILTNPDQEKQKLPANLVVYLAAGAIAGVLLIFSLFLGIEMVFGL